MTHVKTFWRTLFVAHLVATIVCGLVFFKYAAVVKVDPNTAFSALFWLGAPWSAAGQFMPGVDKLFMALFAAAPLVNVAMLARRAFRRELYAAFDRPDRPQPDSPVGELRRIWWLAIVPFFTVLFLYWNYGFLTETTRLEGVAIAQMMVLVNSFGFFLPVATLRILTIWMLVALPSVWLLVTALGIGKWPLITAALWPALWIAAVVTLYFVSRRFRAWRAAAARA
jgi:hypothetical protein